jgi:hypothetical protein
MLLVILTAGLLAALALSPPWRADWRLLPAALRLLFKGTRK